MKIDSIYIATVAHQEDGWLSPLAAFSGKQRTERFLQVQQGIYFPYKTMDGGWIHKSGSYKKCQVLQRRSNYIQQEVNRLVSSPL